MSFRFIWNAGVGPPELQEGPSEEPVEVALSCPSSIGLVAQHDAEYFYLKGLVGYLKDAKETMANINETMTELDEIWETDAETQMQMKTQLQSAISKISVVRKHLRCICETRGRLLDIYLREEAQWHAKVLRPPRERSRSPRSRARGGGPPNYCFRCGACLIPAFSPGETSSDVRAETSSNDVSEKRPTSDKGCDQEEHPRDANANTQVVASRTPPTATASDPVADDVGRPSHPDVQSMHGKGCANSDPEFLPTLRDRRAPLEASREFANSGTGPAAAPPMEPEEFVTPEDGGMTWATFLSMGVYDCFCGECERINAELERAPAGSQDGGDEGTSSPGHGGDDASEAPTRASISNPA